MTAASTFVYVSCTDSGDIHILQMDPESGALEARGVQAVGPQVMPLTVSPDRRCLYAAVRDAQPELVSFRIDPFTGALREIGRFQFSDSLPYLSTDKLGRYLLCASFQQGTVRVHPIGPRGQVHPRPVMVEHNMHSAHCIRTDHSNRFAFAPVRDANMVTQWRFDEGTGRLTPNDPPAYRSHHGAGCRHIEFHPSNRFLYLVNENDSTVDACAYDIAAGKLSHIQTVNLLPEGPTPGTKAADIHLTPDGRFLYASERTSGTLVAYAVHGDHGTLTEIGRYPTEDLPRCFQVDVAGRFLVCAGQGSSHVTVHAIDQETGALSDLARYPVGKAPCWVEIVDLP